MTDVQIKTSDLGELELPELFENVQSVRPAPPTPEELEKVNQILKTTLSADELSTDLLQIFLRDVSKFRLLTAPEEIQLAIIKDRELAAQKAEDLLDPESPKQIERERPPCCSLCKSAAEALVNHNLRMVMTVANRYHKGKGLQGIGYLDLIQEGMIGLIRAVELYDRTKLGKNGKPYRFSTYAMWWIRQAVARGLADKSRIIRVPMHVIEKLGKLTEAEKQMHSEMGREPTVVELADRVDLKPSNVAEILRGTAVPISLSRKDAGGRGSDDGDETELGSALEDATTPSPHETVTRAIDLSSLSNVLSKLHPRTLDIIEKRYGLNGQEETSLTDIGRQWGITYQRVRQIELGLLAELQSHPDLQILREH